MAGMFRHPSIQGESSLHFACLWRQFLGFSVQVSVAAFPTPDTRNPKPETNETEKKCKLTNEGCPFFQYSTTPTLHYSVGNNGISANEAIAGPNRGTPYLFIFGFLSAFFGFSGRAGAPSSCSRNIGMHRDVSYSLCFWSPSPRNSFNWQG